MLRIHEEMQFSAGLMVNEFLLNSFDVDLSMHQTQVLSPAQFCQQQFVKVWDDIRLLILEIC